MYIMNVYDVVIFRSYIKNVSGCQELCYIYIYIFMSFANLKWDV